MRTSSDAATFSGLLVLAAITVGGAALVAGLVQSMAATAAPAPPAEPSVALGVELFVRGLDEPTGAVAIPGTEAFYVLERAGRVRVAAFQDLWPDPAFDLSDRVVTDAIEQGLVGIALHPEWDRNGLVYLGFVDGALTVWIAEYHADPATFALDPASERIVFSHTHEPGGVFHLGGTMRFGPDGFLWVAMGDGSVPGIADAFRRGPDPHTLQGSLLRIDVDGGDGYAIPPTNPFADGVDGAPEVWAYGFRNPWSFAFDDGRLVVADVGESDYEEINLIDVDRPGGFYGWSHWEGPWCREEPCDAAAIPPIVAFSHDEMCAVIGGFVYRGAEIPQLVGRYIFADYCNGQISSVSLDDPTDVNDLELRTLRYPSNFAVDTEGEIYVIQFRQGRIRKVTAVAGTP